jgi:hypothetical protein
MPIHSKMKYDDACMKQMKNAYSLIKENQKQYLSEKNNTKLKKLGFNIDEIKIINAKERQFIDTLRETNRDGSITVIAKYMEDTSFVIVNSENSSIIQLVPGGGTMNRAVASIPSNTVVSGMKTEKGENVMLYSDEWVLEIAKKLTEQWCLKLKKDNSIYEQNETLKIYYNTLSKYILDNKLGESNTTVYLNLNIIQQQKPGEVQLLVRRRVYGVTDNTILVSSITGAGTNSTELRNLDQMLTSGIPYINDKGEKWEAAICFDPSDVLMSDAVEDARVVQSMQAENDIKKDTENVDDPSMSMSMSMEVEEVVEVVNDAENTENDPREHVIEARHMTDLPIKDKNGKLLTLPFQSIVTQTSKITIREKINRSLTKGANATRGTTCGASSHSGQESEDDNTLNKEIPNYGLKITTCKRGIDIQLINPHVIDLPDLPEDLLIEVQPGPLQINVVIINDQQPLEFCEENLETDEDIERKKNADVLYLSEQILSSLIGAWTHVENELLKVPGSNKTTVLSKAFFNHANKSGLSPVPTPNLVIENFPKLLEPETKIWILNPNFVTEYNNYFRTNNCYILVTLGGDQYDAYAPKLLVINKEYNGKDDEVGKKIDNNCISVFNRGKYLQAFYEVEKDLLIRTTVKLRNAIELDFRVVYIKENGDAEPEEDIINMKEDEDYELPYPLQKNADEGPDSWEIRNSDGTKIYFKITFIEKKRKLNTSLFAP